MLLLIYIMSLTVAVLLHETAHFLIARACKCKVEVYSLGFGKVLYKRKIGKTIYQFALLPIGGYCKLLGELEYSKSKYALCNLIYTKKLLIALAGVVVNLIIGSILVYIGLKTNNFITYNIGFANVILGVINTLPIPGFDGWYPLFLLTEKRIGKKKCCKMLYKMNRIIVIVFTILNILLVMIYWKQFIILIKS